MEGDHIARARGRAEPGAEGGGGGIVRQVEGEHGVRHWGGLSAPIEADMRLSGKLRRASTDRSRVVVQNVCHGHHCALIAYEVNIYCMSEIRDTKRILLDAAAAEFALSGLDGARMQAIVKRAGVNERMIYHHFGSKQGLYEAVLVDQQTSVMAHMPAGDVTGDPREAFGVAMTQVMRGLIERPYFLSLMLHEALGGWRNMPAVTLSEVPKSLTGLFKRAQKEGAFRSDVRFESVYLAALGAMTAGYLLSGRFEIMRDNEKRRDRLVEEVLELVLRGAAP